MAISSRPPRRTSSPARTCPTIATVPLSNYQPYRHCLHSRSIATLRSASSAPLCSGTALRVQTLAAAAPQVDDLRLSGLGVAKVASAGR